MVCTGNRHANKIGAAGDVPGVCVPYAEEVSQRQGGGESLSGSEATRRKRGILKALMWALRNHVLPIPCNYGDPRALNFCCLQSEASLWLTRVPAEGMEFLPGSRLSPPAHFRPQPGAPGARRGVGSRLVWPPWFPLGFQSPCPSRVPVHLEHACFPSACCVLARSPRALLFPFKALLSRSEWLLPAAFLVAYWNPTSPPAGKPAAKGTSAQPLCSLFSPPRS